MTSTSEEEHKMHNASQQSFFLNKVHNQLSIFFLYPSCQSAKDPFTKLAKELLSILYKIVVHTFLSAK